MVLAITKRNARVLLHPAQTVFPSDFIQFHALQGSQELSNDCVCLPLELTFSPFIAHAGHADCWRHMYDCVCYHLIRDGVQVLFPVPIQDNSFPQILQILIVWIVEGMILLVCRVYR